MRLANRADTKESESNVYRSGLNGGLAISLRFTARSAGLHPSGHILKWHFVHLQLLWLEFKPDSLV